MLCTMHWQFVFISLLLKEVKSDAKLSEKNSPKCVYSVLFREACQVLASDFWISWRHDLSSFKKSDCKQSFQYFNIYLLSKNVDVYASYERKQKMMTSFQKSWLICSNYRGNMTFFIFAWMNNFWEGQRELNDAGLFFLICGDEQLLGRAARLKWCWFTLRISFLKIFCGDESFLGRVARLKWCWFAKTWILWQAASLVWTIWVKGGTTESCF